MVYGVGCKVYGGGNYRLFCDSHPRGVDRCDMRAGIGAEVEICQTAGDMRADGARRDSAGLCGGNIAYREEMLRCGQLSSAGQKDCRHFVVLIFDVC